MSLVLSSVRFLIVEDHPFQRQMLELALRSLGATEIRVAANGVEAMRIMLGPSKIQIVISDVLMPDLDGMELIPMLAKVEPKPWLLLTSSADWTLETGSTLAEGYGLPLLGAVQKPLTPEKLRPLINVYLAANP